MKATIDREGRITLEKEVQTKLGVKPGDEVILENRGDELIIKSVIAEAGLCLEGNVLVHHGVNAKPSVESLATVRDARLDKLSDGLQQ
ncbi:MAG: AbrB/MazE/SpoVT family DNA-binding domain-containing protein [Gemmataceae bacterium]|nr:AbrB/MazE/SpoVT family DNA-binding domain-containing protein [Gemmataceae bacterium]